MFVPWKFVVVFSVSALLVSVAAADKRPIVKTAQGQVEGVTDIGRGNRSYSSFWGIPYAKPPKRFQVTELGEAWSGVLQADKQGSACVQFDRFKMEVHGSEDCLFLNVHTPNVNGRLPVLVWIHGGGFWFGEGAIYGAKYFMEEDIVLVTFNYRVGPLGFLSTGDSVLPGNLGMKDQVLALKWVQKNIREFGGDPDKVTIFGESAGGASVHYHMLSSASRGLFHHAISQSGTALSPWAFQSNPREKAEELAKAVGCPTTKTSQDILDCLSNQKATDMSLHLLYKWSMFPLTSFGPVVEKSGGSPVFLAKTPMQHLTDGDFSKVPWIATLTEEEGILFTAGIVRTKELKHEVNKEWDRVAPIFLDYMHLPTSSQRFISDKTREFYFEGKGIGNNTFKKLGELYGDREFVHPLHTAAQFHANQAGRVWLGLLSYKGEWSNTQFMGFTDYLGVTHGDDLQYLFDSDFWPQLKSAPSKLGSKLFVQMWSHFAKNGEPGFKWPTLQWEAVSAAELERKSLNFLEFKVPPSLLEEPFKTRMQFWDTVFQLAKRKDEL